MHFNLLSLFLAILPLAFATVVPTPVTSRDKVGISGIVPQPIPKNRPFLDYPNTPRWTNARRLAAGLPPLPPQRRSSNAPRAGPSSIPHQIVEGYLEIRDLFNYNYGYVMPFYKDGQLASVTVDRSKAMKVKFDATAASAGPTEIEFGDSPTRLLGAIAFTGPTESNGNLKVPIRSDTNYVALGWVGKHTPPGSPPVNGANSMLEAGVSKAQLVESSIFRYNSITGEITAQWINADGTAPTSYLANIRGAAYILTADKNNENLNVGWLSFYFVPA